MLNFQSIKFLTSAALLSQLPPDTGAEVAFAGRSNVGKSSALNTLTRQRGLARTSKTPGRTQLINLFQLNDKARLVDLPGYGYAKVSQEIKQRWQKTLSLYLEKRLSLKGLVLLVDIRHPLKAYDEMMIQWADRAELPLHLLLTKADKLSRNQLHKQMQNFTKTLSPYRNLSLQAFSSVSKLGLPELEQQLTTWLTQDLN